MSTQTTFRTRRSVLAAAVGGTAAAAAATLATPLVATATNGANALIGKTNVGTAPTVFSNSAGTGLRGVNQSTSGAGVEGRATATTGNVYGGSFSSTSSSGIGVTATANGGVNATALNGISDSGTAVRAQTQAGQGVFTSASSGYGLVATSDSGRAVHAGATHGTAVYADSLNGLGLHVAHGRVRLDSVSGITSFSKGSTSVVFNPNVKVTANAVVLLSPKVNLGGRDLWYTVDPSNDTFTIHMSSARNAVTHVGWVLIG